MPQKIKINLTTLLPLISNDKRVRNANLPAIKDSTVRLEFGRRVRDFILDRTTTKFIDKNGRSFREYSKSYKASVIFDIYGKKNGEVNLTLTGEMLASINARPYGSTYVELFFESEKQAEKADYHVKGTPKMPRRDFWGVKAEDQAKILKDLLKEYNNGTLDTNLASVDIKASDLLAIEDLEE